MTEPWTARHRDQLLTRVSRTTVLSGTLALVATAGVAYGLAGATSASTLAADPAAVPTPAGSTAGTPSSTGSTTSAPVASASTPAAPPATTVAPASSAPVATSGGS